MSRIWNEGPARGDDIFDEATARKWAAQRLACAGSGRFAAVMSVADHGVFAEGRWHLSKNMQEMMDWLETHQDFKK